MTALEQYQRLECTALWRGRSEGQRQEVVVALGEASLVITDKAGRPLSHWSLPAVGRLNGSQMPAVYAPSGDAGEELEIDDELMVEGIETVRAAILSRRARPGRLRAGITLIALVLVALVLVFWMPGAVVRYTASVVPEAKRVEIGQAVLSHVHRITGGECRNSGGENALGELWRRLELPDGGRIAVLKDMARPTAHLPGWRILISRGLVEDFETPDVTAGFVVAEAERARSGDPLMPMLEYVGLRATFRLLTTGDLPGGAMADYGEWLLSATPEPISDADVLAAFASARIPSSPYAFAQDPTGETTIALIEADPFADGGAPALMRDADWVLLQQICEF